MTIIILSKNLVNLAACVGALRAAGEMADIVVVWDAPKTGDPLVRDLWEVQNVLNGLPGAGIVLRGLQPFCFARNINLAMRGLKGDVVLLNDDAMLQPPYQPPAGTEGKEQWKRGWPFPGHLGRSPLGLIGYALQLHQELVHVPGVIPRPQFGIVSAAIKGLSNPIQQQVSYPHLYEARPELFVDALTIRPVKAPALPFVCVYITRECHQAVGQLDERFTGYVNHSKQIGPGQVEVTQEEVYGGEDDDYCYRARQAGFSLGVYDGCVVDHGTLKSTFRPDGGGRSIAGARQRFQEIHGFAMGSR